MLLQRTTQCLGSCRGVPVPRHALTSYMRKPLKSILYPCSSSSSSSGSEAGTSSPVQEKNKEQKPLETEEVQPTGSSPQEAEADYFASEELISELKTDFGKRGEVFFFAQAAAMVLIIVCPFQLQGLLDLLATLALTTGLVFIAYGVLSLGRNLSPMPQPRQKHALVTTGMYSYVRHPMYAGLLLTSLGLAAITRNETRLALAVGLWFILEKKVAVEEDFLSKRYPNEYAQYMRQVKKFIPFLY